MLGDIIELLDQSDYTQGWDIKSEHVLYISKL